MSELSVVVVLCLIHISFVVAATILRDFACATIRGEPRGGRHSRHDMHSLSNRVGAPAATEPLAKCRCHISSKCGWL